MEEVKIKAEPKDNNTCQFTVNRSVYPNGSIYFSSKEHAAGSSLAEAIFAIDSVESLLIQDDSMTVSASTDGNWMPLAKEIGIAIRSTLQGNTPPIAPDALASIPEPLEIKQKVQTILDNEINPAVASHGGWVELIDVQKNEVFIKMGGGCQGCGMADVTLKQGVAKSIRNAIPQIGAIMDTTDHASGRNPYYAPSK